MREIDISIIIPFYRDIDRLRVLLRSLRESFLAMSKKITIEIIVINDSPEFDSIALNSLKEQVKIENTHIYFLNNEYNIGVADSRNVGRSKACGRYLTFVDQDDFVEITYFTKIAEAIKTDSDIILMNSFHVWEEHDFKVKMFVIVPKISLSKLIRNPFILTPGMVYFKNKSFTLEFICYNREFPGSDDWGIYLRLLALSRPKIHYIEDVIFNYVTHDRNASGNRLMMVKSSYITLNNISINLNKHYIIRSIKKFLLSLEINMLYKRHDGIMLKLVGLANKLIMVDVNTVMHKLKKTYYSSRKF